MAKAKAWMLGAAALALSGTAEARPFFVGGSIGPAIGLGNSVGTQLKLTQEFGYHFTGGPRGLFVSGVMSESFVRGVVWGINGRIGYDIPVWNGSFELQVSPWGGIGFDVLGGRGAGTRGAFDVQVGADLKFVLLDQKLSLYVRPVAFDLFISNFFGARYDMQVGAYFNF